MLSNLRYIIAIELLSACQGIDLLAPLKTGALAQKAYAAIREKSPTLTADRQLSPDIEIVAALLLDDKLPSLLRVASQ
jgi:histidine ammonia-lyase